MLKTIKQAVIFDNENDRFVVHGRKLAAHSFLVSRENKKEVPPV